MMRELFSYLSCFDVFLCCFSFVLFLDDDESTFLLSLPGSVRGCPSYQNLSFWALSGKRDKRGNRSVER